MMGLSRMDTIIAHHIPTTSILADVLLLLHMPHAEFPSLTPYPFEAAHPIWSGLLTF